MEVENFSWIFTAKYLKLNKLELKWVKSKQLTVILWQFIECVFVDKVSSDVDMDGFALQEVRNFPLIFVPIFADQIVKNLIKKIQHFFEFEYKSMEVFRKQNIRLASLIKLSDYLDSMTEGNGTGQFAENSG